AASNTNAVVKIFPSTNSALVQGCCSKPASSSLPFVSHGPPSQFPDLIRETTQVPVLASDISSGFFFDFFGRSWLRRKLGIRARKYFSSDGLCSSCLLSRKSFRALRPPKS